jgi:energy-coupling factor transporter ATP-binding protein EcfA2
MTVSGRKEPLDHTYLDHLSDILSIQGRLKHLPSELSGGEQQRVAIARALITRPAIVLADEPTGNLDTKSSDAVLHMLLRSNRELGQTTLMITHNPKRRSIAGRILHMRDGEIVREEKGSRADEALPAFGAPQSFSASGAGSGLTSIPWTGILKIAASGSSSVVEHCLAKARVASSSLVSRSIPPSGTSRVGYGGMERSAYLKAALPRRGTQVVRERSAKPLCAGSIPARASNHFNNLASRTFRSGCRLAANWPISPYETALYASSKVADRAPRPRLSVEAATSADASRT